MANVIEGDCAKPSGRFAIVAARFNAEIVSALVGGALDAFSRHAVAEDAVDLIRVPGSFEIPVVAKHLAESKKYAAVVCLGAVIKGDTDHYDYVSAAATHGILQAGLASGVPVIFGVLTCETWRQAVARAGGKEGNKGFEAAVTAIEMANLMAKFSEASEKRSDSSAKRR